MQDTELFLSLAEIAGVFVGFGSLIAVRSSGPSGRVEVGYTRGFVLFAVLTIGTALAPVILARYDLTEHQVWALSSVVVLLGWVVFFVAQVRTPEYRANIAAGHEPTRPRWAIAFDWVATGLFMTVAVLVPIIIILGVAPGLEATLYSTVVVVILLGAAWLLLALVYAQREPASA
jgi:uncharacterized protein YacL